LVPLKGNQYRPHLIRPAGLSIVLAFALLLQVAYGFVTTGHLEVLGRVTNVTTEELVIGTNDERTKEGMSALQLNNTLSRAAFLKAQDMFANDYWAHVSPSGVTPWKWLGDVGYNYSVAGENLAKNYPTASATVDAWMNSETHKANILNNQYTDIGFAVVDGDLAGRPTTLVVAYYGAPVSTVAVQGEKKTAPIEIAAPVSSGGSNPIGYFASALQSLNPMSVLSLGLLAIVGIVAVAAHHYRDKLPKTWRKSWKLHHGMYTLVGVVGVGALIVLATGGGSI
jgi:hypothetical protein